MSQTRLTSFFPVRKQQVPDQHAAKKRKIILSEEEILKEIGNSDIKQEKENIDANTLRKEGSSLQDPPLNILDSDRNVNKTSTSAATGSVVTSAVDNVAFPCYNILDSDRNVNETSTSVATGSVVTSAVDNVAFPCTPSTSNESSKSAKRTSKNNAVEKKNWTPTTFSQEKPLFTIGTGSTAKKKLDMNTSCETPLSRRVSFKKLGTLSPRMALSVRNSPVKSRLTKTPIKASPMKLKVYKTPLKTSNNGSELKPISRDLFGQSAPTKDDLSSNVEDLVSNNTTIIEETLGQKKSIAQTRDLISDAIKDAKDLKDKLKPGEVKAKLGNVKLADLRNRLAALNNSSLKAKQVASAGAKISLPSKAIDLELVIPPSPKKTPLTPKKVSSGVKASPRKVPAYQRFHSLTQPTEKNLPLPYSYRVLEEVFRSMDTVVSMYFNRNTKISKQLLAKSVKQMTNKPFLPSYLGQVYCVFPQAYHFKWERIQKGINDRRELYILPNLGYKRALLEEFDDEIGKVEGMKMMSEHLVERHGIFRNSLVQLVKDAHSDFLKTLDPPITVIDTKLTAWHREFDVDSCAEIETAALPENPDAIKVGGKLDLEERINSINALADSCRTPSTTPSKAPNSQTLDENLSGVSPSLVAKIRAKEAAKELRKMTRPQEEIDRISLLKRLPSLARMLRNLLTQEKKAALTVEFARRKLRDGIQPKPELKQVEDDLRGMAVEIPGWINFHIVGKNEYLKIGKTDINKVCERLEKKRKELEG